MRFILLAVSAVLLVAPVAASAQEEAATFADVSRVLDPGRTVVVTDANGRNTKGKVTNLTPSSLTLVRRDSRGEEHRHVFDEASVTAIKRTDSVWNGLLIGTAAGFAATEVFIWKACGGRGNDSECEAIVSGGGWLIFVPSGAVIGGLIDRFTGNATIYRTPRRGDATISLSPLMSRSARGAAVSIRF